MKKILSGLLVLTLLAGVTFIGKAHISPKGGQTEYYASLNTGYPGD